jgi:signal transduction histidine kinase
LAISSKNKNKRQYISTHFRFALIYVIVTLFVLLFLNIYTSRSSQELFYKRQEATMIERCHLIAAEIRSLDVINASTVSKVIQNMVSLRVTRLIVTDSNGVAIYDSLDSNSSLGSIVLLPEIVKAMDGYNIFSWSYKDGTMLSRAASPIISYDTLLGCVYMTEYDEAQGALIASLQKDILTITICLEIAVILFALSLSKAFTDRVRHLMASMHIIREGDYSHQVDIRGHDEITVLGQEFNGLVNRLQDMEDTRRQFVSNASHELKTPLASIKLLSDSILQNEMDMDTVREFVEDIGNEADRLNRMSQNLLSLSKADAMVMQDPEIIEVESVIRRTIRMLSPLAQIHNITILTEFTDACPVLTSEDDLYQIIFNLIENGIKYNTAGGNLYITLRQNGDAAVLTVQDEGNGIPEDCIAHIFDRFYRVDKARSRSTGGSGLGLSIVKELVHKHQGEISVRSTVGAGSSFTLRLPIFDTEELL